MKLARVVTHNFGAKVLAVMVALLIWFNASGQEQVVRIRTTDLVLTGLADTLAFADVVPATADVRISASRRRVATLGFRRLDVVVDLAGLGPGRHRLSLSGQNVRGATGVDPAVLQVVAPVALELNVERVATRRLPVLVETTGELPAGVVLMAEGMAVEPAWVTVRGPASALDRILHVRTAPVDLARVRDGGTRAVALAAGAPYVTFDPARVTVRFDVSELGERVLANVPPTVLLDSPLLDAAVDPSTVSLTLQGPSAVLDTLSSGDVSVLIEVTGLAPATYRLAPIVILPRGLELARMSVDSIDVRVFSTER